MFDEWRCGNSWRIHGHFMLFPYFHLILFRMNYQYYHLVYHANPYKLRPSNLMAPGPSPPNCWTTDGLWRVRQKPTSIRIFLTTAATEDFRDPKDAAIWGQLLQRIFLLGPDSSHFYPLLYVTNSPPGKHSESNQSVQCCQDAEERRRNRCCSYLGLTESPLSLWGTEGMPGWRHHAHFITLKHTKKILWYLCLMDMFPSLSESEVMTDTSGYNNHPWPKFAWIKIYCNYMYLLDMSM